MKKIKKAIIPAAGLGTRLLPATKAMPKEMLPIVDKPAIQYIVEEAINSGIEDILIVTGKNKRAIEDHFDRYYELEENLRASGKVDLLREVQISSIADIHYLRQKETNGLGHAIWCARRFIGNEPFAVLLGDDIVRSDKPALLQLIDLYNKYQASIIGVQPVERKQVSRYGIVDGALCSESEDTYLVNNLVEKPQPDQAPSNLAIMGRYILTPKIFDILEYQEVGVGNEIQLTDAIRELSFDEAVYAHIFKGARYDVGDKLGFIKTTLDFALLRPDMKMELLDYLKRVIDENENMNIIS